jgi:hypothetical protein
MSDTGDHHQKLLGFLMGEWARKDNRQLTEVHLLYAPGNGFKDEDIRKWIRADEPDLFAEFVNVERLVTQIIDIANGEADAKPAGKHRFLVRTIQHLGGRATHSFALSPSYTGGDEVSLTHGGGGGRGDQQVISNHASQLMRINAQMFEGTIRVLGQQNMNLHEQVTTLTSENTMLRRELEEARSNKMDREFQIAMAAEKNNRTNAGFQKLLSIGSVIAAKIGAGAAGAEMGGGTNPLQILIGDFYKSLRNDQAQAMMGLLDMNQKMLFMEIVNTVTAAEQKAQQAAQNGQGPPPPNGAPPNGTPPPTP